LQTYKVLKLFTVIFFLSQEAARELGDILPNEVLTKNKGVRDLNTSEIGKRDTS
jgi:hypothetical protein